MLFWGAVIIGSIAFIAAQIGAAMVIGGGIAYGMGSSDVESEDEQDAVPRRLRLVSDGDRRLPAARVFPSKEEAS